MWPAGSCPTGPRGSSSWRSWPNSRHRNKAISAGALYHKTFGTVRIGKRSLNSGQSRTHGIGGRQQTVRVADSEHQGYRITRHVAHQMVDEAVRRARARARAEQDLPAAV